MFQIQGTITEILPETSGVGRNGNNWTRTSFVVEYIDSADNKQKRICFSLWNKVIGVQVGTIVDVVFSLDSAQYNGKWFVNVTAHEIKPCGVQPQMQQFQQMVAQPQYTMPQQQQYRQPTTNQAPPSYGGTVSNQPQAPHPKSRKQEDDDMPF